MAIVITNVTELQAMENDLTADYELGNYIDASATSGWNEGAGFEPIGQYATPFTGSFDGKNYIIDALYINRSVQGESPYGYGVALFGSTSGATLQNVTLASLSITGTWPGGSGWVGRTAGLVATAPSTTITHCKTAGTINGYGGSGGLVGLLLGTDSSMSYCSSNCSVTSTFSDAGGLLEFNSGTITKCVATGSVVAFRGAGGFIESNGSTGAIENCYARGDVLGDEEVGGFVGGNSGTIENCYSTGAPTGNAEVGGFCGDNGVNGCFWDTETSSTGSSDGGTGKTTAQMKTESTFTDAGWDFDTIWHITTSRNNGYPIIRPAGFGHYWVEGGKWTFIAELGKQQILGTDTTADGVAGHFSVEGNYWHYLDSSGNERRQKGKDTGNNGTAGHYWIDDLQWYYIDSSGNIRRLGTWIVGQSRVGVDMILHT